MPHTFFEDKVMLSNYDDHRDFTFTLKITLPLDKVQSRIDRTVIIP